MLENPILEHLQLVIRRLRFPHLPPRPVADYSQNLYLAQGRARHEDALVLERRVGRDDLKTDWLRQHQVICQHSFGGVVVMENQTNPEPRGLRPGGERAVLAPGLAAFEIANKTNGFYLGVG